MSKAAFFITTFIICNSCFSASAQKQPYRYQVQAIYKMTSQPDSTDKESAESEYMTLLSGQEQSLFCATRYLLMDSAITAESAKGNNLGPSMGFFQANGTHNSLVIFKDTSSIITYNNASRFIVPATIYQYTEPKAELRWTIQEDTLSIGNVRCQKATVNFGNRNWIAWFAPSIPVSDGPYKFCGLPGLIFRIYDVQQYWNFDLVTLNNKNTTLKIGFLNKVPQPIKDKQAYLALKKYSRDNRYQLQLLSGTKFSNPAASTKAYEQGAKKDNNWIELPKKEK
ncbi:MAG: GLPGLI family protein [Sphingobacteriaceae bacterium]|nr:MAG: GLPGLI family protein [Sphingobacteriaceae bacterium]